MTKEDYSKYYIKGSDHYLIPKDVFDELFGEMENWKQDTQKYKEVIDKAMLYINSTRYIDITGLEKYRIKEFWFIEELFDVKILYPIPLLSITI